jgi:hypothetical protein
MQHHLSRDGNTAIPLQERLVDRMQHRLDPLEFLVHRACRQVQVVLLECLLQPSTFICGNVALG